MSQADAARALNVIISAVSDCLVSGDSITIQGFGTFKISEHKERKGRNPSTGEAMTIPARKVPKFAPERSSVPLFRKNRESSRRQESHILPFKDRKGQAPRARIPLSFFCI